METAFSGIRDICRKHHITNVTLVVPTKRLFEGSIVGDFMGAKATKALLKGEDVLLGSEGPSVRLATEGKFSKNRSSNLGLVVGAHISEDGMAKIDDAIGAEAILYLPWNEIEGRAWLNTWQPETLGPTTWKSVILELPEEIEAGLINLTEAINSSTGLLHPIDKAFAERIISDLRTKGHEIDPTKIKQRVLQMGWSSKGAAALEAIAKKHR